MDTKLLMHIAYRAIIEEVSEIEERLSMINNLPRQRVWRQIASRHDTWATRQEWVHKERAADKERLDKLIPLLVELEAMYREFHAADDEAWAEGMANYFRMSRRST